MINIKPEILHWIIFSFVLSITIVQDTIIKYFGNYVAYVVNNSAHSITFILLNLMGYVLSLQVNNNKLKNATRVMIVYGFVVLAANVCGISHYELFKYGIFVLFLPYIYFVRKVT